jgi:hypothetical protein
MYFDKWLKMSEVRKRSTSVSACSLREAGLGSRIERIRAASQARLSGIEAHQNARLALKRDFRMKPRSTDGVGIREPLRELCAVSPGRKTGVTGTAANSDGSLRRKDKICLKTLNGGDICLPRQGGVRLEISSTRPLVSLVDRISG